MTLFRTLVDIIDFPTVEFGLLDTISWQGKLWLVPKWKRAKTDGNRTPERIIRPQLFQFERPISPQHGEDYSLACLIPKPILDGQDVLGSPVEFDVVEDPDIEFPIPNLQ